MCIGTITDALQSGALTLAEISRQTRVSSTTIAGIRDDIGLHSAHERVTKAQRAAAIALAAAAGPDADVQKIAAEVGASQDPIRRLLRKQDLISSDRPRAPISPDLLAVARMHLEDRAPYREVARTTGIGIQTLIRHFPDMGADRENRALLGWINGRPDLRDLYVELSRGLPTVV